LRWIHRLRSNAKWCKLHFILILCTLLTSTYQLPLLLPAFHSPLPTTEPIHPTHTTLVPLLIPPTPLIRKVRRLIPIRIILLPLPIVIIVHILRVALRVTPCLDAVVLVHPLGFGELVDFGACEAHEELFCEGVVDDFSWGGVSGWW
jgi:hypothetical protein